MTESGPKTVLLGPRVVLRRPAEADIELLVALINEPAVAAWWGAYDAGRAREEMLGTDTFAIELDREVIGLVLVAEENEPDYRHAGLDIAIATAHQGNGLGRESLSLVIDHLVRDRGHHRLTIDPAAGNERAIRCYAALGFQPVGIMRAYERQADGTWGDGLLMELIARPGVRRPWSQPSSSAGAPAPARDPGSGPRRGG